MKLGRLRGIAQVMIRHGLGFLLVEAGLGHLVPFARRGRPSRGYRLRTALEELGPTFVKLGQALSVRHDLLPPDVIRELEGLQDRAQPMPFDQVITVFLEELERRPEDLFASFSPTPLAAASIGQVHLATLPDGRRVAVKVQRLSIREQVETDLKLLEETAALVEARTTWGKQYGIRGLIREFSRTLRGELDYRTEADHCRRFLQNFQGDPDVRIPTVISELSSQRILTLEYENGIKITDVEALGQAGYQPTVLARKLVRAMMRQIFQHGLFHADPHPGNVSVLPGEVIFFMDFGQVGYLSPSHLDLLQEGLLALARGDVDTMVQVALDLGAAGDLDEGEFSAQAARLLEKYYGKSLGSVHPVEAVRDALDLARSFRIKIPAAFALLGKALGTLEAVVTTLDPEISVLEVARPTAREIWRRRASPRQLLRRTAQDLEAWWAMFRRLPRRMERVVSKLNRDSLGIRFSLADESLLRRLERITTHLALAILFLGLAVLLAGLVVAGTLTGQLRLPPWVFSLPFLAGALSVLGLLTAGLVLSLFLGQRSRRP